MNSECQRCGKLIKYKKILPDKEDQTSTSFNPYSAFHWKQPSVYVAKTCKCWDSTPLSGEHA